MGGFDIFCVVFFSPYFLCLSGVLCVFDIFSAWSVNFFPGPFISGWLVLGCVFNILSGSIGGQPAGHPPARSD